MVCGDAIAVWSTNSSTLGLKHLKFGWWYAIPHKALRPEVADAARSTSKITFLQDSECISHSFWLNFLCCNARIAFTSGLLDISPAATAQKYNKYLLKAPGKVLRLLGLKYAKVWTTFVTLLRHTHVSYASGTTEPQRSEDTNESRDVLLFYMQPELLQAATASSYLFHRLQPNASW